MSAKAHFTPRFFRFLKELKANNRRDWFLANKPRYEADVRDPMLNFIADFAPRLRAISRHYVADPRPMGGSMFRINRDTRFSPDKSPYKTNVGAQFTHATSKDVHSPSHSLPRGLCRAAVSGPFARPRRRAGVREARVRRST